MSVALTGNVAAGKSTVADLWRAAGVPVVSADVLARQVVSRGSDGLRAVVALMGSEILCDDGSMNRAAVRERVFSDETARRKLEAVLHPRIEALRREWLWAQQAEGHPLAVAEIPLLFEAGLASEFDASVLVDAPEEERMRRLVEVRGLEPAEARRILEAQMDPSAKRALADYCIDNAGSVESLAAEAERVLQALNRRAQEEGA